MTDIYAQARIPLHLFPLCELYNASMVARSVVYWSALRPELITKTYPYVRSDGAVIKSVRIPEDEWDMLGPVILPLLASKGITSASRILLVLMDQPTVTELEMAKLIARKKAYDEIEKEGGKRTVSRMLRVRDDLYPSVAQMSAQWGCSFSEATHRLIEQGLRASPGPSSQA